MNKITLITLLSLFAFFSTFNTYAKVDSTIFKNDVEKKVFFNLLNQKPYNNQDLFIGCNLWVSKEKVKTETTILLNQLKSKCKNYKLKKKVKYIKSYVETHYYKQFSAKASYSSLFSNGSFNETNATALYALLLDSLNVPYEILYSPISIKVIADPLGIKFDMTKGIFTNSTSYNSEFKKAYVEYIYNNKSISEDEFNGLGTDDLFNKHYVAARSITIRQLAAYQYLYFAIQNNYNSRYDISFDFFAKANILYPKSSMINFLMSQAAQEAIYKQLLNKRFKGRTVAFFLNANYDNKAASTIANDIFLSVGNYYLVERKSLNEYLNFYKELEEYTSELYDMSALEEQHFRFLGYNSIMNKEYTKALDYLANSYNISPENEYTKELVLNAIFNGFNTRNPNVSTINTINKYLKIFPFLENNQNLISNLGIYYLTVINDLYKKGFRDDAEELLCDFEDYYDEETNKFISEDDIINLYLISAFNQSNKVSKDEVIIQLKRGLYLIPNSRKLNEKIEFVKNNYTNNYNYYHTRTTKKTLVGSKMVKQVYEIICGDWKVTSLDSSGDKYAHLKEEVLSFGVPNSFRLKSGKTQFSGTWKYYEKTNEIYMLNTTNFKSMTLSIETITKTSITGFIKLKDNSTDEVKITLKKVK